MQSNVADEEQKSAFILISPAVRHKRYSLMHLHAGDRGIALHMTSSMFDALLGVCCSRQKTERVNWGGSQVPTG